MENVFYTESILGTIKKMLGIPDDYSPFDVELVIHINTVFGILNQLGVGPKEGFSIYDTSAKWSDFLGDTRELEMVKTYIYLKVKNVFDPSGSSVVAQARDNQIKELESRLNYQVDPEVN